MYTVISSPSISELTQFEKLFPVWKSIDGNQQLTEDDYWLFISSPSLQRNRFLHEHAVRTFDNVKSNIVIQRFT